MNTQKLVHLLNNTSRINFAIEEVLSSAFQNAVASLGFLVEENGGEISTVNKHLLVLVRSDEGADRVEFVKKIKLSDGELTLDTYTENDVCVKDVDRKSFADFAEMLMSNLLEEEDKKCNHARVIVRMNGETEMEERIIKRVPQGTDTEKEEDDNEIFFYVNEWDELKDLQYEDKEDFKVVDVLEYFD